VVAAQGTPSSSGVPVAMIAIGFALAVFSPFIAFPVGCNLANSCPADPVGWWSTAWPNVLSLDLGIVLIGGGFGRRGSERSLSVPLGLSLILSGIVLLGLGLSVGYMTSCPANGCPPLTESQSWALFWPNVIADSLGVALLVAGAIVVLLASQRQGSDVSSGLSSSLAFSQ
jgi:hypothetical protein